MKIKQLVCLCGVVGVVFYFLHVIFGSLFYPDYNPMAQAISDLTASDSPSRNIAVPFSMLYGIFTIIFSIYFFVYFRKKFNKLVALGAGFFCVMTIVSFLGYTFFPLSKSGYEGTFQDKMHILVTVLVVVSTIYSLILFCIGFFKTKNYKYLGIISLCTLLLLALGVILINTLPKEYFGIAERTNVYSIVFFTGILSIWMFKNKEHIT